MKKNNLIKAYLTYRLPSTDKIHSFSGKGNYIKSIADLSDEKGFVFYSFDRSQNILISDLLETPINSFSYYYSNDKILSINKTDYLKQCSTLIEHLKNKDFTKVIYSRISELDYNTPPDKIFSKLNQLYKNTFNYLISIEGIGTWIGSTPEKLAIINQHSIQTTAIAGTKLSTLEPWGQKEKEEQQIVTDFIEAVLTKNNCLNIEKSGPTDIFTGVVSHLKTDFVADINFKHWPKLVSDLHPTPATCGLPKDKSFSFIQSFEQHDRKYYTGFLGPLNNQSAQLFVNLRCMSITKDKAYLYIGGGITKDSDAEKEWQETINKSLTLKNALD